MTELTNERAEFEAWQTGPDGNWIRDALWRDDSGEYGEAEIRRDWIIWQAARRATPSSECALPQEVATVVSEYVGCGIRCGLAKWTVRAPEDGVKLYTAQQVEQIRREAYEAGKNSADAVFRAVRAGSAEQYRKLEDERDALDAEVADLRAQLAAAYHVGKHLFDAVSESNDAQLARQSQEPQAERDGWKWVPIEPTDKMRGAVKHQAYVDLIDEDWAAMLAAAPAHPVAQPAPTPEPSPMYFDALKVVKESQRASVSLVQRKLSISWNQARDMVELMLSRRDVPIEWAPPVYQLNVRNGTATSGADGEQG